MAAPQCPLLGDDFTDDTLLHIARFLTTPTDLLAQIVVLSATSSPSPHLHPVYDASSGRSHRDLQTIICINICIINVITCHSERQFNPSPSRNALCLLALV